MSEDLKTFLAFAAVIALFCLTPSWNRRTGVSAPASRERMGCGVLLLLAVGAMILLARARDVVLSGGR